MSLIKNIFPFPVLDTMLEDWEGCKDEIKSLIKKELNTEMLVAKEATYTTNGTFVCSSALINCPKTKSQVEALLKIFADEVGIKELMLTDSWINQYEYQQFLPPHNHLPHQVTGTIFIDIPPNGGEFFFSRPSVDTDQILLRDGYTKVSEYSIPAQIIIPIEGQILVFMSNLYHASAPVKTPGFLRYTMAFNANCRVD